MRDIKRQRRQIAPGSLPWGIANGMWFAKSRRGRYRIREGGRPLRLGAQPERPRVERAARRCLRHRPGGQACGWAHYDELSAERAR